MNILHLHLAKNWGGGGINMLNFTKALTDSDKSINFQYLCAKGGQLEQLCKDRHFRYQAVSMSPKIGPAPVLGLIKLLKSQAIDLIHIHGPDALTIFALTNLFFKTPPGVFHKKTTFPIKQKKLTLYKYNHPNLKRIICVSNAVKKISAKAIKDNSRLVTVYSGTNFDVLNKQSKRNLRKEMHIPSDKILIGNIANHIKAKDLDTWVNTIDELINHRHYRELHFVQIGKPTELTKIYKTALKDKGLLDFVSFTGPIPGASQFLNQFDYFLFTSKSEGLPQVIYETLLTQTPVITTNAGGIEELVHHKVNGIVTPIGDHVALADGVEFLLKHPKLKEAYKKTGYNTIVPELSIENCAKDMFKVYQEVVNL